MDEKEKPRPRLITLAHAAELLGVSRRTVSRLAGQGRLRIVFVTPDCPRLQMGEVERFIAHIADESDGPSHS